MPDALAALQVSMCSGYPSLFSVATQRTAWGDITAPFAAALFRSAIKKGQAHVAAALLALLAPEQIEFSPLLVAAQQRPGDGAAAVRALATAGFAPSTDDVLALLQPSWPLDPDAPVWAYLEGARPIAQPEVATCRVAAMRRWLDALAGQGQVPCPILQVLIDRARSRPRRWCGRLVGRGRVLGEDLALLEAMRVAGLRPTVYKLASGQHTYDWDPLADVPDQLLADSVNRLPRLAALKLPWQEERHRLFPSCFKVAVRTLLLCAGRAERAEHAENTALQGLTAVLGARHLREELLTALAYPMSSWVVGDGWPADMQPVPEARHHEVATLPAAERGKRHALHRKQMRSCHNRGSNREQEEGQ